MATIRGPNQQDWNDIRKRLVFPAGEFRQPYMKVCEQGTRRKFAFDPCTASMWVRLSQGNTSMEFDPYGVRSQSNVSPQSGPDKLTGPTYEHLGQRDRSFLQTEKGRFNPVWSDTRDQTYSTECYGGVGCVLGDVAVKKGRYYWEVVVEDSREYWVGIACGESPRHSWIGENNTSWCMVKRAASNYLDAVHNGQVVKRIQHVPYILGVLLDYDRGYLAFYNSESKRHLHTFFSNYTTPVVPAFAVTGGSRLTIRTGLPPPQERPSSHYFVPEQQRITAVWTPERPHHFAKRPEPFRPPWSAKNNDGTWGMPRTQSSQYHKSRLDRYAL